MKTAGRKSVNGLKSGKGDTDSVVDAIVDHVEKNDNCEIIRIMGQFSKMDDVGKKKLMSFARKLTE